MKIDGNAAEQAHRGGVNRGCPGLEAEREHEYY
jgi:hypothetical protein